MTTTGFHNNISHCLDGKLYILDSEDHTWELKESFAYILNGEDEEVEYEFLNSQLTLHILKVSFLIFINIYTITLSCRVYLI